MWIIHRLMSYPHIHEILHFLSACIGAFVGCWLYFLVADRSKRR
jgi:membrane protein DedA with SNARE-associated domain